jgi:hypothetical protein
MPVLPKNEKAALALFLEHLDELVRERDGVIDLPDGRYMLLEKSQPMTLEIGFTPTDDESVPENDDVVIFQIGLKRIV